jgi:hypothetical protein
MLFLVIALLVFITQTLLSHWWLIAIDCFVASLLVGKKAFTAFFSGFFGVALVWLGYMLFVNSQNEGLLLGRIGELFGLKKAWLFQEMWLVIITSFLGGLMGGMSALTGYYFKTIWKKAED